MSADNFLRKLQARVESQGNNIPTPLQMQRKIEENLRNQVMVLLFKNKLDYKTWI